MALIPEPIWMVLPEHFIPAINLLTLLISFALVQV